MHNYVKHHLTKENTKIKDVIDLRLQANVDDEKARNKNELYVTAEGGVSENNNNSNFTLATPSLFASNSLSALAQLASNRYETSCFWIK